MRRMSTGDMVAKANLGTELDCASRSRLNFSCQSGVCHGDRRKEQNRAPNRQAGRLQMARLCLRQGA